MISGKGSLSIRKSDVTNQTSGTKLFKRIVFAHKANVGDTVFDLMNLSVPSEMTGNGFTQPTKTELLAASMKLNRSNLKLKSSLQPDMADFLDYSVDSNTRVTLSRAAAQDEIFIGVIDIAPATGAMVIDAMPIIATGTIAAGSTDINVGTPFPINKYSTSQVGAVTVFVDGQQIFRNTGNSSTTLDANYYELDGSGGTSSVIRLNTITGAERSYLVISNGIVAERPAGSFMAYLENVQGQVNKLIEVAADLSGLAEAAFRAAPSNVDLKSFGDRVLSLESDLRLAAVTWAGIKTFADGVRLDDDLAGGGATPLDYYRVDDATLLNVTWTFDGGGGSTTGTVWITRVGRVVTLELAGGLATTAAVSNNFVTQLAMPVWARPTTTIRFYVAGVRNNNVAQAQPGYLTVTSGGILSLSRDALGTAWGATTPNCGFDSGTAVTYPKH